MEYSQTREELLINTVKRFNSKNRSAIPGGSSAYYMIDENGKKRRCGIGIEMPMDLAKELESKYNGFSVRYSFIFEKIPKRLQNMGRSFLGSIQNLHDKGHHWNKDGLSSRGKEYINQMISEYNLNLGKVL